MDMFVITASRTAMNRVRQTTVITLLYVGCWCAAVVGGVCVESWCPPPVFPDLLAAFAGSLSHSPAMRNLTVELLSPGSPATTPCRHLLDCCLPLAAFAAPRRRPCSVDRLPPLPSCRTRSRDPNASGRERPAQFSRSLEDGALSADWFESALSKSVDHPDGAWQVPDPAVSSGDGPWPPSDGPGTDRAGSRTAAAAADVDVPQLWSSVRGRLLIGAVSVSMIASVVVLTTWICLRKRLSKYEAAPETEQEAICMYERVLADRTRSRDRRHHSAAGTGNDVISDERTLIGCGEFGATPTRRYV